MIVRTCISLISSILIYVLLAQAILSWFANPYGRFRILSQIYAGLSSFTYPLTAPARLLLSKFNTGPMDFSLFLTMLFIIIIREILLKLF